MKRKNMGSRSFGKKNIILAAVALILVGFTAFGSTVSWIEEVSEVEFKNTDGQQTPAQIGSKILESDILTREANVGNHTTESSEIHEIDLNDYFNRSGDIHLSPCFGDGEKFYFPVEQKTSGDIAFREGTKDDANVNYLSATFKLRSLEANTVYWFAQSTVTGSVNTLPYVKFKNGSQDALAFQKYLRCSITVDGATNVYSLNDTGNDDPAVVYDKTYKTIDNGVITDKTGRSFEQFTYCDVEDKKGTVSQVHPNLHPEAANQGSENNLNGNTLFTVNKFVNDNDNKDSTIKTITVKIWLECPTTGVSGSYTPSTVSDVDIADINLNLVSSWAKTRRIYVHDKTVSEWDSVLTDPATQEAHATGKQWLTNDPNAKMYWALEDSSSAQGYTPFAIRPVPDPEEDPYISLTGVAASVPSASGTNDNDGHWYYFDLPAVYNNRKVALFRCNGGWNQGSSHTENGKTISYWDKWSTTFPDTYHSEVFTIYSHKFATWRGDNDVNQVYFINSAGINANAMTSPHSYMWDSHSIWGDGINDKVVKNKDWPGEPMTRLAGTASIGGRQLYTFFYLSDFDSAVFSDGRGGTNDSKGYQTQDVVASSHIKHYFDMSVLKWYTSSSTGINYTDNYLRSNINQDGTNWAQTNFIHGGGFSGTSGDNEICRIYAKSDGFYDFQIKVGSNYYGVDSKEFERSDGIQYILKHNGSDIKNVFLYKGIHSVYLKFSNNSPTAVYISYTVESQ